MKLSFSSHGRYASLTYVRALGTKLQRDKLIA